MDIKKWIRDIPDFPQPGVLFRDVSPLLKNPEAMNYIASTLTQKLDLQQVDYFAGIESRGFIFAADMAARFNKGFVPIRKAGKLPPPTVKASYSLEYGKAEIELSPGDGRVIIVDDVLATGGTLQAAIELCTKAGYSVADVAVVINLTFLNQMKFQGREIRSVIQY